MLAYPPYDLWALAPLAVAPLAWLALRARSTRRAVLVVFAVQFAMWLWMGRWLIEVTIAGYPAYAAYLSIYAALFVWMVRRIGLRGGRWAAAPMTIVAPVLWVGLECLKGTVVWNGYPWFLIAHPLIEQPVLAQSADLFGAYFVSFLGVMISGLVVDVLSWRRGHVMGRTVLGMTALAVVMHAANVAYGAWRMGQRDLLRAGPHLLVIQTNLPQDNKIGWTSEAQARDFQTFAQMTLEAVASAKEKPDLVVWPETMLPGLGLEKDTIELLVSGGYVPGDMYSTGIVRLRDAIGIPMLVGSPAYIGLRVVNGRYEWDENYNSAYLIQGDPPFQRYDKYLLTPFGETMPYISAWPWLQEKLLAIGAHGMSFTLDTADEPRLLDLKWAGETLRLATPICFEDTVSRVCRRMAWASGEKRADVFVNLSNDGWFGASDAGRAQHLQAARYRCIENRVPMVRAVNTGLSASVDSTGNVVGRIGGGRYGDGRVAGSLLADVVLDGRRSLYGTIGDLWAWACLAGTVLLAGLTFTRPTRRE